MEILEKADTKLGINGTSLLISLKCDRCYLCIG